tara:strand:- start:3364 stop:4023 length:660 start_codon:yes stop_codon:yes gene_type:complete
VNPLIKINLNQTVSKTELKERKTEILRWALFSFITASFLSLIVWLSLLIIRTNNILNDQISLQAIISKEIDNLKLSTTKIENFDSNRLLSISDIEKLKGFQNNKRIFWGPKLIALIDAVPEDMVITNIELINRRFKMVGYARYDSINPQNTAYKKGKELEFKLKNSPFIANFKLNKKKEPLFSLVEYEDDIIEENKIHKIIFEGELQQTLNKKSRRKKK